MEEKEIVKEYSKGEITVVWKPKKCIHSANCAHGLPDVFNPEKRPWINPENASPKELKNTIDKCPSGALSYYMNDGQDKKPQLSSDTKVQVIENGPLIVFGALTLTEKDGEKSLENKTTAFCRCGASDNKPYCDGAHKKIGFQG